jgi:hypothetical protein
MKLIYYSCKDNENYLFIFENHGMDCRFESGKQSNFKYENSDCHIIVKNKHIHFLLLMWEIKLS